MWAAVRRRSDALLQTSDSFAFGFRHSTQRKAATTTINRIESRKIYYPTLNDRLIDTLEPITLEKSENNMFLLLLLDRDSFVQTLLAFVLPEAGVQAITYLSAT